MMRHFLIVLFLCTFPAVAEEKSGAEKKRYTFSKDGEQATASQSNSAMDPSAALSRFFEALKADQLEAAYSDLVKNTIIAARPENVDQLKEKTRAAIDNFGPVKGYEVVETLEIGKSLYRQTCISLNEDLPLRWRFYFYRSGNQWKIVDLRVDDGIVELFEEIARNRKK
jgi:predicted GNAT family acetyltransferase